MRPCSRSTACWRISGSRERAMPMSETRSPRVNSIASGSEMAITVLRRISPISGVDSPRREATRFSSHQARPELCGRRSGNMSWPGGRWSVDPGDDPPGYAGAVLVPECAVLGGAAAVVVDLAWHEQADVVEGVQPGDGVAGCAEGEGDAGGHEDLAEVVDVAGGATETPAKQYPLAVTDRARLEQAEGAGSGVAFEQELLHVGPAREGPAGREDDAGQGQQPGGRVRVGPAGPRPEAHAVKVGVEDQATPAELEAHTLGEQIVCVEVDVFEGEVVQHEEG